MGRATDQMTGKSERTEWLADFRCPPVVGTREHDYERIKDSWAEVIDRCRICGHEMNTTVGF